ncbi:uncharacterized protein LOC113014069 [Astatotilapia calliptera]|uniref:uncharacterized protein LOC113014069 n=1 Tax=Astatotilapia calliptera TaxID=8154 RepID=UPI000E421771|nr:uncharacterized protein LOC113014069 [Astatotilapia calliptera]
MDNDEELLLKKLDSLVTNIKWGPKEVSDLFKALLKRYEKSTNDKLKNLVSWMIKMLHCIEIHYISPRWKYNGEKSKEFEKKDGHNGKKRLLDLVQDESITDETLKKFLAEDKEKTLDEILDEIRQENLNQVDGLLEDVKDIVSTFDNKDRNDDSERGELKNTLQKLCWAVEKTFKYKPRLTQMVSWCLMALSKTGRLIQVGTGEGKSCIVAMFAAFRALRGEKVDIMSSSSVLAERDFGEWQRFYELLKISVDCNTNKLNEELKKCYECKVVYGTAEQFAGDWLRHTFTGRDILGQRTFQCAIVDEVDSLMLDKGHHMVYLSSDMPALQHLNPLLAFIWNTVNQYGKIDTKTVVGPKHLCCQVALESIKGEDDGFITFQIAEDTGILTNGSVENLRKSQGSLTLLSVNSSVTVKELAEFFNRVEQRFPSCHFALYCINSSGTIEEFNKEAEGEDGEAQRVSLLLSSGGLCQYMYSDESTALRAAEEEVRSALRFTPCELSLAEIICYVPGFFSDLVKSKLNVWIKNAFYAQTMTKDHEYVIEKHGIVPVDYSCTGVVENCMKWSDGLQQFLEMKHESKLSDMTAITNYMSNVGLLQKYGNQIYGMSGTLGKQVETKTLQKIYDGIKTCQIPSFKRRKLFEVEGVVVSSEEEWVEKICHAVIAQTTRTSYRDPRAALVICETINRANIIHQALGDKVKEKSLYINNNMDNSSIFSKELKAGEVIIATNLAGRGTDLQITEEVKRAGGLFVVQTFLPENARVEAQAFGRSARQGAPGSAQLIISSSHLSDPIKMYQKSPNNKRFEDMSSILEQILTLKSEPEINLAKDGRESSVAHKLSSYLESDIPNIKKKEELFNQYLDELDDLYKSSNNKPAASDLSALNEFWGMWLLTSFNAKDSTEELKGRLKRDLDQARLKLRQRESPSSNLYHYIGFGNDLREKGNFAESIDMYTKATEQDPCWGAIAYYNRAFTTLKQQNRAQSRDCISQALDDLKNAFKSVQLYCDQIQVTYRVSKQHTENHSSDSPSRIRKHFVARYSVLSFFKENITEAIKKVERSRDMGGNSQSNDLPVQEIISALEAKA